MMSDAHRLWTMCATLLRAQVSDPVWHTAFEGVRGRLRRPRADARRHQPLAKERIEGRYLGLVRDALPRRAPPTSNCCCASSPRNHRRLDRADARAGAPRLRTPPPRRRPPGASTRRAGPAGPAGDSHGALVAPAAAGEPNGTGPAHHRPATSS